MAVTYYRKFVFVAITIFFLCTIFGFVIFSSRQSSPQQTAAPHNKWSLLDAKDNNALCKNTAQGKLFITDNKGHVCTRDVLNSVTGCCPESKDTNIDRFSCNSCEKPRNCCSIYEFCVSCCLNPSENSALHRRSYTSISQSASPALRELYKIEDDFEFCMAICRTSSRSVINQNKFKSQYKYCFSDSGPEISVETATEEVEMTRLVNEINTETMSRPLHESRPIDENESVVAIIGKPPQNENNSRPKESSDEVNENTKRE